MIWRRFRVRYSRDYVKHRLMPRLGWRWHKHTWLPAEPGRNTAHMTGPGFPTVIRREDARATLPIPE